MRGVTLPLDGGDSSCLACGDGGSAATSFLGDLPTISVKTKKRTATVSPPPRSISLLLLIPSAPLAAVRVANRMTGSVFSESSIGSDARIGPCDEVGCDDSVNGVFRPTLPFLLLSLMLIASGLLLPAIAKNGRSEWQMDQDRTINLIGLGYLQK